MADMSTTRTCSMRLADGRRLTFAQTVPPEGRPVTYCHGAIGTPLRDGVDLEAMTHRLGVRHIAVNRPGFGGSDPAPGRGGPGVGGGLGELVHAGVLGGFA